jgi:hypothetical protein
MGQTPRCPPLAQVVPDRMTADGPVNLE